MTDIGATVGIDEPMVIGVIGMLTAIVNCPIYKRILGSRRKNMLMKLSLSAKNY